MKLSIGLLFAFLIMRAEGSAAPIKGACATGILASQARQTFATLVSDTSALSQKGRTRLHLPKMASDSVTVVVADSLCAVAADHHFRRIYGDTTSIRGPISLIRVGATRFVIEDYRSRLGEYFLYFIYDSDWKPIAGLAH